MAINRRKAFRAVLRSAVLAATAFVGACWFVGGALVAPANHVVGPPPDDLPVESITISSKSGGELAAWYIPADDATATVILLHPLRGDRRSMLGRARLLHEHGYATLLVDLQAHGESPGDHVTAGYRERHDVAAAVDYVRVRSPRHKVAVIGRSLGGAATLLATPVIDALVLESVYPTIEEAVHNRVALRLGLLHHALAPALLAQLQPRLGISPTQLRPIDHIAAVECPVLIAAGECDLHTTLAESRRLFDTAREPKQIVIFAGAAHVDLLSADPELYGSDVLGFLRTHLQLPDAE